MKKIIWIMPLCIILICGCAKKNESNLVKVTHSGEVHNEESIEITQEPVKEKYMDSEVETQVSVNDAFIDLEPAFIERINYYYKGECTSYIIPEYDGSREIGGIEYSSDGQKSKSYSYEYDATGNMVKETWFNQDGTVYYWNTYEYNSYGEKSCVRHFDDYNGMMYYIEYEYNEQGQCNREIRYDRYGTEQSYFDNEYDELNYKVKSNLYNLYSGNKTHWIEYEYDQQGNCISETWYQLDGSIEERIERQYADGTELKGMSSSDKDNGSGFDC